MTAQDLKAKWRMDDGRREADLDEQRLDRCQYRIQYEPYSLCDLNDKICIEDTGNSDFDVTCENNTTREDKE